MRRQDLDILCMNKIMNGAHARERRRIQYRTLRQASAMKLSDLSYIEHVGGAWSSTSLVTGHLGDNDNDDDDDA